ncbi:hypothetical protein [Rhodococcus sp. OK302]|nr:hypothetical protein [Rhodococcus sp. OK302]OYD70989.1 hypothetical protein BDB13_4639 [Rhodococcus sp. OK302]
MGSITGILDALQPQIHVLLGSMDILPGILLSSIDFSSIDL